MLKYVQGAVFQRETRVCHWVWSAQRRWIKFCLRPSVWLKRTCRWVIQIANLLAAFICQPDAVEILIMISIVPFWSWLLFIKVYLSILVVWLKSCIEYSFKPWWVLSCFQNIRKWFKRFHCRLCISVSFVLHWKIVLKFFFWVCYWIPMHVGFLADSIEAWVAGVPLS